MCEVIDFRTLQLSLVVKSMAQYTVVGGGQAACRERQRDGSRASPYYKIRKADFVNASPTLFFDQIFRERSKFCIKT